MKQSDFCIPRLFQERAAAAPEALAVRAGSERLSYRELDLRSNRLANYLGSMGVAPGTTVALCLDRSVDFPVSALGVLKAGAAYLPLEPKTPVRRLETMLNAARLSAVLTTSAMISSMPETTKVLSVDEQAAEISRCSADSPAVAVTPEHLAYVIYTSGSTGMPKAVAVGHDNLLNLCRWHNRVFEVGPSDRATQIASVGFDAAVWELWPHLIAGASVHLVEDEIRTQPQKLRDWIVGEKITISFVPTPLAEQMLKVEWPTESGLRFLLTGADTLHEYPPARLPFKLVNNYGPTECTVVATSGVIASNVASRRGAESCPSIGRAIDNAEVYILDGHLKQVAIGTIGEVYIGGAGVARGYLNDSALTAERFVANPFSPNADAKLYRTGDLGKFLPDGEIAFHGRADDQVKIRGYRIELNEIASTMKRHAAIRDCAVVAGKSHAADPQLIAYVVPKNDCPALSELRDFLSQELPEYMIPGTFVSVSALPISHNGKVDRTALPTPSEENMVRDEVSVSPRTATERRVAGIVTSLLGLESVGAHDNFFYLGGNSLFGTQVIARVRDAFHVEIPLLGLFDHPTVAELSAEIERLMIVSLDAMSEEEAQRLVALNTEQANV